MKYFIILRLPVDYETQYDLTDLDDIAQLKIFMRYECQQMSLGPGDNTNNYDKWLSLHSSGDLPSDKNFTVLVKQNLVEEDSIHQVLESHNKLFENVTSPTDWCISDADGTYIRCKDLDALVSGTKYFAWHNSWYTYYTTSSTPSANDDLYIISGEDPTATAKSTITELGDSFNEISIFSTELGTFTKLTTLH